MSGRLIDKFRGPFEMLVSGFLAIAIGILPYQVGFARAPTDTTFIIGNGTAGPYFITGCPLLADTLVIADPCQTPLANFGYSIQANPARVTFLQAVPVGDTLTILFSALPFSLPATYEAFDQTSSTIQPVAHTVPVSPLPRAARTPTPFKLEIKGAKTFGITTGNHGGTQTRQGLQLAVNGQLTETVTLTAAISDRLSDRLSSGATASRINDLDEFFVAIQGPSFGGRLGDLSIDSPADNAVTPRRLSGAQAKYDADNFRFSAAAGKLAGIIRQTEFFPEPGNQGPYALTDRRRTILPNSETVYIDGQQLDRGSDRDYDLDYFTGEITFSPNIKLNETRRIRVEFEESAYAYLRRAAFADWQSTGFAGKLNNNLAFQWEADDPEAGIGFGLGLADRDTLSRVADGYLVRDGAEYVGTGNGEYIQIESDTTTIYEYVGPDEGDYNVRFEYVGASQGAYVHLGGGAFGYLGDTRGDYRPSITITAPTSRMLVTDRIEFPNSPVGTARICLAATTFLPNRLNEDSRRTAWAHDILWSSPQLAAGPVERPDGVQVSARWRRLGDFGRSNQGIQVDDLARKWFLPVGRGYYPSEMDILESSGRIALDPRLLLTVEYDALAGTAAGRRDVESLELQLSPALSGRFMHQRSHIETDLVDFARSREIWSARQTLRRGPWEVFAGVQREDRRLGTRVGDRFDGYEIGLGLARMRLSHAADRVYTIIDTPMLSETRQRLALEGAWALSPLRLTGAISAARTSRRRTADGRLFLDHLGQANFRWNYPQLGLVASANYKLNKTGTRYQTENFIPVTDGFGNYRREDSIFVPDAAGDFTRVIGSMGAIQPTAAGQKELILRRTYGNPGERQFLLPQNLAAELRLSREERINPEYVSIWGWAIPWGELKAEGAGVDYTLLRRETSALLEHRFPTTGRFWFLRGRYRERYDSYGAQTAPVVSRRRTWEISAHGNLNGRGWENWKILLARKKRISAGYSGMAGIEVLSHRGEVNGSYRFSKGGHVSAAMSLEHLRDRSGYAQSIIYGLAPSATLRLGPHAGAVSLKSGVEYFYVDADLPRAVISGISSAYYPGHNARFVFDGRLEISKSVSANVRSSMDVYEQRPARFRLDVYAVSEF